MLNVSRQFSIAGITGTAVSFESFFTKWHFNVLSNFLDHYQVEVIDLQGGDL